MNESTTIRTTTSLEDRLFLMFKNPIGVIQLYQIGYGITFLFGFLGNIASLLTFSRLTLRRVSTSCLFMALAISDMSFLLSSVFDIIEFGFQVQFWQKISYESLCRFRMFITSGAQFSSAWILVFVSIDRWIRTRFPFKSNRLCTPKKILYAVFLMLFIDVGLHSHILTPMFGTLIPGFSIGGCNANFKYPQYLLFYLLEWTIIQIVFNCLLPAALMSILLIHIMIYLRSRKRAVNLPNQSSRQRIIQRQMFILMFASICIFLITSLPVGIYKIASIRERTVLSNLLQLITIWTILGWFQSLFFAIGFYIHCLSSPLFRKEFLQLIGCNRLANQNRISMLGTVTIQLQRTSVK